MKSPIVFNQIPRPTRQTAHSNSEGPGARAMHLKVLPADFLSVTNETCHFLQADLVRTLPVLMIYACRRRKEPEAEFGSAQGLLSALSFSLAAW